MHVHHNYAHTETESQGKDTLCWDLCFFSAPVRMGGSTAPDTHAQVCKTKCKCLTHIQKKMAPGSASLCVFAVSGDWCEWSEWTPCSRTCGAESVSRYRSCGCPEPKAGGEHCSEEQEIHNGVGVQIQRQPCPVITFCPGKTSLLLC